ncbi:MAG: MFS transporter [Phenylobacterium sp.]|uniref:MFS transporter n=1 Tax=Phenylobacterium sp. TaxID=1871053 RepID=UPI002733AF5C|nr:MFS transporter [Phenylobacterium sp.]MDP3749860.1 MFS transporter [Phenylobacterium sp.]
MAADERRGAGHGLLVLLTLMNVLNFVDRQLLSSFANFIVPDLQLTNTEFGLLTGLVFIAFYAVAGFFMGALADMVNRPRLIGLAMFAWSALTAASGLARNFVSLAIPRMFIGVGESALTPTAMSLLADRYPLEKRGFAAGFYYMGVPIGVGVSLLVAGFLGPAIGWRNCFYLLGAIGVAFSLVIFQVKETRAPRLQAQGERPKLSVLLRVFGTALAASPALQLTIAGGVVVHFLLGAAAFDQLWLVRERGFERAEIAVISGLIACVAGVAGNLFGGVAVDRWVTATGQSRQMFMVWVLLALLPINLTYRLIDPDSVLFWVCMVVAYFQLGAFYGPTFSAVQELCPAEVRSTVVAFYIMSLNVVGLGVGITGSGIMVDALIARGVPQPYSWTLFSFTCLSALAILCYLAAARVGKPAVATPAAT